MAAGHRNPPMNAAASSLTLSRTTLPMSLAALFAGAALSVGVVAIADSDELPAPAPKVVTVEAPSPTAVDESAVADAIAPKLELRGSKASATSAVPSTTGADDVRPAGPRGLASGPSGR
jgi:hypothetical protein